MDASVAAAETPGMATSRPTRAKFLTGALVELHHSFSEPIIMWIVTGSLLSATATDCEIPLARPRLRPSATP
ncbi:hypothetical protein, partial [Bradyrhizobium sp.]|uniref:hypothetical protein n=1 Tax=Bradyrhizobium sp. TaxID=376 RepID=UPI002902ACBE